MNDIDLFRYLTTGSTTYTLETIVFNLAVTAVLALFLFWVYKITFTGVLYSLNFNVSLIMISLTTAMVIMLIGSNLAISLGMVGALSIVRFRSAVKEQRDLAFLFWAIGIGLAAGTGVFLIAGVGSVFIFAFILVFSKASRKDYCYLLVLKGESVDQRDVEEVLAQYKIKNKLRMQNVTRGLTEITFEIYLKQHKGQVIVNHFKGIPEIQEVNLVSFNGEITG